MTIYELEKKLKDIRVPSDSYSIMQGGLPNETYCLSYESGKWIVYYSERGDRSGLTAFESESEACAYFYDQLKGYGRRR